MHRRSFLLLGALLAAPPLTAQERAFAPTPGAVSAAEGIRAEDVRRRIGVIADDSMRGRATPSPGLDATAAWVAGEFRRLGLEPGGDDGGFVQRYRIETVTLATSDGGAGLVAGRDLLPSFVPYLPTELDVRAPVVEVGGTEEADALPREGIEGRLVVVTGPSADDEGRDRATLGLVQALLARDPLAVLVATDAGDRAWRSATRTASERRWRRVGAETGVPVFDVRDASVAGVVDAPALRSARGRTARLRPWTGDSLAVRVALRVEQADSAPNTVGILRGSDPALRDEYVVFSAHMDHVGVGRPDAEGDSVFNGADDDASGTATVVELAEAFAALDPAPRRSLVFLGVSGEEKGLWGSEYFAARPPVPAEAMVADLNIDMIGRNWRDTIVAIGREHSDLGTTLDRVVDHHPELSLAVIDDPWPEESFYTRSDHFNFARLGVPVLFFFSGTHDDYHQPSDEVALIDAEKTARIGRLVFWLGLAVADAPERPRWDPASYRRIVEEGGR